MSESRGLYHNDSAVVAFYLAILQSIAGEPAYCEEIHHCDRCNKKDIRHHATGAGREQHMLDRFGYGFKEQTKIRGAFFHDGEFVNISDALFEIHDKIHFEGLRTEANLAQSDSLWEVHESTQRLGTTVRKNLAELFLERYAIR